jgi:hypothetical protein
MAKARSRSKASQQRPKQTGSQTGHIDVFPHELRVGDRYTDDTGHVWEVAETPSAIRQGKVVAVRFKGANDPSAEWRQVWAAHERVRVRRV